MKEVLTRKIRAISADRALVMIDRGRDPLAKIQRIGTHGSHLLPRY